MKRVAQFFKVSFENFAEAVKGDFPEFSDTDIQEIYDKIQLPGRATRGSAGYDFFAPFSFALAPGETVKIPTGIIDSDYFNSDNEGHIFIKMTNDTNEGRTVEVPQGTGFAQGIFIEYGITVDDQAEGVRNGGLGSTTK